MAILFRSRLKVFLVLEAKSFQLLALAAILFSGAEPFEQFW